MNKTEPYFDLTQELQTLLDTVQPSSTKDAVSYAVLDGGKRLRPRLLLVMLDALKVDMRQGLYEACALECIHTYSLIHDDLPALDNDDLRRNKPTNHKVFGEDIAILAGDALLTYAFELVTYGDHAKECVSILARYAGLNGMILGQELDLKDAIHSLDALLNVYELKTGCLFAAAFEMAAVIAGRTDLLLFSQTLGKTLGRAFQIQDDLLESTQSTDSIGKSTLSDAKRGKKTILSFLSLEDAQAICDETFAFIYESLKEQKLDTPLFIHLIDTINTRRK